MKTKVLLFAALTLVVGLTSCQKIQDSLTVTVPVDFTVDLNVEESTPDLKNGPFPFNATETLDPNDNADYAEYKEKIKSITPSLITFTFNSLPQSITLYNATLRIGTDDENVTSYYLPQSTVSNSQSFTWDLTQDQINELQGYFDTELPIWVIWEGTASADISYNLSVLIKADVKASILGG